MTYDETLKALRCCTDSPRACSSCPAKGDQLFCVQKIEMEAASAIESLQKEVKTLEAERDWWKLCVRTLPQMPKWIPVTEKLPEERINPNTRDFEYVQCVTIWGDVRPFKYGTPIGQKEAHFWNGGGCVDAYVTHWRPLTAPP